MLNPGDRLIYLNELRPPEGYRLDRAIATTFSMDLMSLLMAPLSMALNDVRGREETLHDPIAVLEALDKTAERFAVFCQSGRITVPRVDTRLYTYLEKVVMEVQPASMEGVFHPKTWLLRFAAEDEDLPVVYRFLCLSRNLTFDRSWDTILTLDGVLEGRKNAFSRNRPLAEFVAALPRLACGPVRKPLREHIDILADEVLRVRFEPPEQFENKIGFLPSGIPGHLGEFHLEAGQRNLVMSPFLSEQVLEPLTESGENNVLISRLDSLDTLSGEMIAALESRGRIFFMDEGAERPDDLDTEEARGEGNHDPHGDLSGLHAKLYVMEHGWHATIGTGSANATNAAYRGFNVEFVTELEGRKSRFGIDKLLGSEDDKVALRNMLRPYVRSEMPEPDEKTRIRMELEEDLEAARRYLSRLGLTGKVSATTEDCYTLAVTAPEPPDSFRAGVTGRCHPISLPNDHAVDISSVLNEGSIEFADMSLVALTGFVAFELSAERDSQKASVTFVLNLPMSGVPSNRNNRILHHIIADRRTFLRLLFFILAGDDAGFGPWGGPPGSPGQDPDDQARATGAIPLLEELIRAYSRRPEKIDRIGRLIDDLKKAGQADDLLPEGFDAVWQTFVAARRQGGGR